MMASRLGDGDEYSHHHQGSNTSQYSSSLVLLQERFNQLQKTREMRLEKEQVMMKLISTAAAVNSTLLYHQYVPPPPLMPSRYHTCDSDLVMFHQKRPSSSSQHGFSLIQPERVNASASSEPTKPSSSWLFGTNLGLNGKFDDSSVSDVDTSLHL